MRRFKLDFSRANRWLNIINSLLLLGVIGLLIFMAPSFF